MLTLNKIRPRLVHKDVALPNGLIERRYEFVNQDYSKPYTPQEGIETLTGDIAFMTKAHITVQKSPAYLSLLKSGNPFDLVKLGSKVSNQLSQVKSNVESKKTK